MADTTDAKVGLGQSALEKWLGTFADDITGEAYRRLCAIQQSLAHELGFLRSVIDSGRQQQAELLQRAETAEAALAEARRDVSLWRRRWIDQRVTLYQQRDGFTFELAIASAEDDANRIDYEFQQADAALHQRKENGHDG